MFKQWLLDIAGHLKSIEVNSPSVNGRRMCSVLIILNLLDKIVAGLHRDDLNSNDISVLFSMLCLKPNLARSNCDDLDFLKMCIPYSHHKVVADFLVKFTNTILPMSNLRRPDDWLYVIPLIHIFENVPTFGSVPLTSNEIKWKDSRINLWKVPQETAVSVSR